MEFLDGAPLSAVIANHRQLPIGTLLRMIEDVLSALGAAHAEQIVHRDLKPDNIFISPKGRPKVLDFGIAKLAADQTSMKGQTKEGSLLGTPHYMSPEQALGQAVDARSDIYSIGVILYECATGQTPFQAEGLFSLLQQHVSETPSSPRLLRPDISDGLEAVIMRALEKDPAKRWQNVQELAFALQQEQHGLPEGAWAPIGVSGESSSSSNRPSQPPSGVGHLSHASPSVVSAPAATGAKTHLGSRAAVALLTIFAVAALVAVLILSQMDDATQSVAVASDLTFDAGSEPGQEEAMVLPFDAGTTVSADTEVADTDTDTEVADTDKDTEVADTSTESDAVAAAPVKEGQGPRQRQPTVEVAKVDPKKVPASPPAQTHTKTTPAAASKAAPKDAVPVRDSVGTKSASSFNMTSYFPTALARARKAFPDAVLVRIDAQGVLPSGNANLTLSDNFDVTYRFISPSRSKRPADLPLGMEHKPTCMFYVNVTAKETNNYPLTGWKCSGMAPLGRPRCSAKDVWKRAIADGAPKSNAVAELGLRGGKWWFDIKGTYSKTFQDDC
jgi:serine/threonine-protein kinase